MEGKEGRKSCQSTGPTRRAQEGEEGERRTATERPAAAASPEGLAEAVERHDVPREGVHRAVGGARKGKDGAAGEGELDRPHVPGHRRTAVHRDGQNRRDVHGRVDEHDLGHVGRAAAQGRVGPELSAAPPDAQRDGRVQEEGREGDDEDEEVVEREALGLVVGADPAPAAGGPVEREPTRSRRKRGRPDACEDARADPRERDGREEDGDRGGALEHEDREQVGGDDEGREGAADVADLDEDGLGGAERGRVGWCGYGAECEPLQEAEVRQLEAHELVARSTRGGAGRTWYVRLNPRA